MLQDVVATNILSLSSSFLVHWSADECFRNVIPGQAQREFFHEHPQT
jgi:hypothetical protein